MITSVLCFDLLIVHHWRFLSFHWFLAIYWITLVHLLGDFSRIYLVRSGVGIISFHFNFIYNILNILRDFIFWGFAGLRHRHGFFFRKHHLLLSGSVEVSLNTRRRIQFNILGTIAEVIGIWGLSSGSWEASTAHWSCFWLHVGRLNGMCISIGESSGLRDFHLLWHRYHALLLHRHHVLRLDGSQVLLLHLSHYRLLDWHHSLLLWRHHVIGCFGVTSSLLSVGLLGHDVGILTLWISWLDIRHLVTNCWRIVGSECLRRLHMFRFLKTSLNRGVNRLTLGWLVTRLGLVRTLDKTWLLNLILIKRLYFIEILNNLISLLLLELLRLLRHHIHVHTGFLWLELLVFHCIALKN